MIETSRRGFLRGAGVVLITAPAIVRAGNLMPIRRMIEPVALEGVPLTFDGGWPELAAATRRAFMPRMYVQIWQGTDLSRAIAAAAGS